LENTMSMPPWRASMASANADTAAPSVTSRISPVKVQDAGSLAYRGTRRTGELGCGAGDRRCSFGRARAVERHLHERVRAATSAVAFTRCRQARWAPGRTPPSA
jgi:hypothetical protein